MDQLQELRERAIAFANSAYNLMKEYDKTYQAASHVGAIVFDNLRPVYRNIDRQLLRASTRNKKLVCIIDNFQDQILTLKDFMCKIYDESQGLQQDDLKRSIGHVIGNLSSSLNIVALIRHKLGDQRLPVSWYDKEGQLETVMTERVADYLPADKKRTVRKADRPQRGQSAKQTDRKEDSPQSRQTAKQTDPKAGAIFWNEVSLPFDIYNN
eukprot:gene4811-21124_t